MMDSIIKSSIIDKIRRRRRRTGVIITTNSNRIFKINSSMNFILLISSLMLIVVSLAQCQLRQQQIQTNETNVANFFQQLSQVLSTSNAHLITDPHLKHHQIHHHHHQHHHHHHRLHHVETKPNIVYDNVVGGDENHSTLSSLMLKTFIRINNMRVYHLDLHSYRDGAKFIGDPSFVISENNSAKLRCSMELEKFYSLLKSFYESDGSLTKNSLDSIKLADTFGRPDSGVLKGNQYWLGSYDGCKEFSFNDNDNNSTINGQYCLGMAQFPNWNPQDGKTSLKIGLCLPELCTSSIINDDKHLIELVERMMLLNIGDKTPFNKLKLRQVYCLPHETSEVKQYSLSTKLFFLVFGSFLTMSLIATLLDYLDKNIIEKSSNNFLNHNKNVRNWKIILIQSFSLIRSYEKFLYIRPDDAEVNNDTNAANNNNINNNINNSINNNQQRPEVDSDSNLINGDNSTAAAVNFNNNLSQDRFNKSTFLNSLNGLKCIGLLCIICGHTYMVSPIPSNNMIHQDKITKTYLANIYLAAHFMVDTFFALSGLLASYFLFKQGINNLKMKHWIVLTVHRYWRLTPIYLLCYWFAKSVSHLLNDGPFWDYMTSPTSPRLNCHNESWLEAILHLSDFKSPKDHCVPFAWFIANGIKFWILTPIFLIIINKSIKRGYIITSLAIIGNILLVIYLALNVNVDIKAVFEFKPEVADNMLNNMEVVYTRFYSRIGAYLIGLLAGHLMYLIDTKQIQVQLTNRTKTIAWTLFTITVIVLTFLVKLGDSMQMDDSVQRWFFAVASAIIRPLWSLCTCWLVFALAHGHNPSLAGFLSANVWRILVKLSFCAYLAQGEVIAHLYLSSRTSTEFSYINLISNPILTTVVTLFVSIFLLFIFEYPLCGIEELILPIKQKSKIVVQQQNGATKTTNSTKIIDHNDKICNEIGKQSILGTTRTTTSTKICNGDSEKLKLA